jgi:hypothetical protein
MRTCDGDVREVAEASVTSDARCGLEFNTSTISFIKVSVVRPTILLMST